MLVLGVCNPKGENSSYNGLYFTQNELQNLVDSNALCGTPIKTEHVGNNIGTVVSGFLNEHGQLQCVMELDDSVEGSLTSGFVRNGIAADLSLGYTVDVAHSEDKKLKAGEKRLLEISLVRRGARHGCHVQAYQDPGKEVVYVGKSDPWHAFNMQ